MAKRESEDNHHHHDKKSKVDKKDDIAIDSELLGQQSLYGNADDKDEDDITAAEAAAAAAVAAGDTNGHQEQASMQHLAYHNAYRHSQQQQGQTSPGNHLNNTPYQATTMPPHPNSSKPLNGSDEWHRQRRENHKEVERRRRESINYGIKELAALIPTPDTNKAQILQRAVEYIKRLKENENNNIEKWTLEKLLTEQAVSELSASNEKLKQELERAYREIELWKELAREKKD